VNVKQQQIAKLWLLILNYIFAGILLFPVLHGIVFVFGCEHARFGNVNVYVLLRHSDLNRYWYACLFGPLLIALLLKSYVWARKTSKRND